VADYPHRGGAGRGWPPPAHMTPSPVLRDNNRQQKEDWKVSVQLMIFMMSGIPRSVIVALDCFHLREIHLLHHPAAEAVGPCREVIHSPSPASPSNGTETAVVQGNHHPILAGDLPFLHRSSLTLPIGPHRVPVASSLFSGIDLHTVSLFRKGSRTRSLQRPSSLSVRRVTRRPAPGEICVFREQRPVAAHRSDLRASREKIFMDSTGSSGRRCRVHGWCRRIHEPPGPSGGRYTTPDGPQPLPSLQRGRGTPDPGGHGKLPRDLNRQKKSPGPRFRSMVTYLPKFTQHFPHRVHWNSGITVREEVPLPRIKEYRRPESRRRCSGIENRDLLHLPLHGRYWMLVPRWAFWQGCGPVLLVIWRVLAGGTDPWSVTIRLAALTGLLTLQLAAMMSPFLREIRKVLGAPFLAVHHRAPWQASSSSPPPGSSRSGWGERTCLSR